MESCHICGCTDEDCSGCIAETGTPCHWVHDPTKGEQPLCSACKEQGWPEIIAATDEMEGV